MSSSSPIRLSSGAIGLSAIAILFAGATAFAQATYDVQVPFQSKGALTTLASPRGVAVAPDGTVYVTEIESATTGRVIRITPSGAVGGTSGGTASLTDTVAVETLSVGGTTTGLREPDAVAVDSAGDLYIADLGRDRIYELTSPETSSTATELTYAGSGPTALAIDSSNNLYVADEGGAIYKFVGGVGTALPLSSNSLKPIGLAVDSAGDVIFASGADNELYEYSPASGITSVYLQNPSTGSFQFSAAINGMPIGMGFDPAGNLYVLDSGSTDLWQINPATPTTNYLVPFSATTTAPGSLAVSNIGNLYISDDSDTGTVTPSVAELFYNNNPINMGTIKASTNSPLLNANYGFYAADSPIAEYQTVEGDYTGEFTIVSASGTCTGAVGVCNGQVEVNYQASTPGLRNGVIGIIDSANNVMAVHIVGICEAASLALYPGTANTLSASSSQTLYEPQGEAVSGDGKTFFIADEGGVFTGTTPTYPYPAVYAYTVSGGIPTGTPTTVGSFTYPLAVALDALGNLYVADYSGYVSKIPPTYNTSTNATTWSGSGTRLTFPSGVTLNHPIALAVDIYNNLYIGDAGPEGINATSTNPGYIVKVPGDGGLATELKYVIGGTPVVLPDGLTTDSFGNLYIADGGDGVVSNGSVDVVPVATGEASTISFGSFAPLNGPGAVAFDAASDLYVLDSYNSRILVVPFTYSGTVPTADSADIAPLGGPAGNSGFTSTLYTPTNLVVWPGQNTITVTDIGYEGSSGPSYPVQVVTLASQDSTVDATSGSATVTGINTGNEEITFKAPTKTGNTARFVLSGCGTTGVTVEPGLASACTSTITYTPSGTAPQSVIITLNGNANKDGSALGNQIIATGIPQIPKGDILGKGAQPTQSSSVLLENIGGGNLTVSGITVTGDATLTDLGTCNTSTSLTYTQTCSVTFTFNGNGTAKETATVSITDNNGGNPGTVQTAAVTYTP